MPPLLDDKILSSWNGLMLAAMAAGYRVLGHRHYLDSAERAADSLLSRMARQDGGLFRTARGARAHVAGFLEDYACLSDGLIALYEAGGSARYLREARPAHSAHAGRLRRSRERRVLQYREGR